MPKKASAPNRSRPSLRAAIQKSRSDHAVVTEIGDRPEVSATSPTDDERWRAEQQVLRRAAAELAQRRTQLRVASTPESITVPDNTPIDVITKSLDDPSSDVRNAAVRALYNRNPEFAASFFNRTLREGPVDQRRRIGAALVGSGLVGEAIQQLRIGAQQNLYGTISLLFLVAKAGEVQPLLSLVEEYPSIELRLALIELLALSGEASIVPAFRRLSDRSSLPAAVRSALLEAIHQISGQ